MAVRPLDIDDDHHVARHVKNRLVQRVDGKIGCFPGAFKLRDASEMPTGKPEEYLSVYWLECFAGTRADQVREVIRQVTKRRTVKDADVIALGNALKIKTAGTTRSMKLRVMHEPKSKGDSYSAIRGLKREDAVVLDLLAAEVFVENFEVASSKP